METASNAGSASSGSRGGRCEPFVIDNVMFLKDKTCPLCNCKNWTPNVVTKGPLGPMKSKFIEWGKGTPENPGGRFDKLCITLFSVGSFAEEFGSVDKFIESLREKPVLQAEWDSARKEFHHKMKAIRPRGAQHNNLFIISKSRF